MMEDLITELGTIRSWYDAGDQLQLSRSSLTKGHNIIVETIDYSKEWNLGDATFTVGRAYRYFIEKRSSTEEKLSLHCQLINPGPGASYEIDTDQWMEALLIKDQNSHLSIGTEDTDKMLDRLEEGDQWVPKRFLSVFTETYAHTEEIKFGLKINVPALLEGERVYFHFAVVADKNRPHPTLRDKDDPTTRYLVNMTKKFLDQVSPLSSQLT